MLNLMFTDTGGGPALRRNVTWAEGTAAPKEAVIAVSIPRYKKIKVIFFCTMNLRLLILKKISVFS